ncbi:putative nucleotide kinase/nuclear protein involved oxidative stress response [Scheffersomyces stipitis CBS 6054]|uniref:Adenylate kinase isoenzyme 6 homolog n=1 Tax=Scheffersomyces stipitis (strain ATCC 58785 / CBS 6054 / NBRC 10063 / NRRL Y-11545) TaxID=322104 RepID=A3GFC5_PICST|nr:Predicted nucleotide kinase/nuclear protein involved oxidative stress response [Scheffersomyces stipitis CBS 6054]EAZ63323.2 putative nucleotide kinase/nuclear protein involved oxidative stress response [Scheffersomyces stipitis CBS 6054]
MYRRFIPNIIITGTPGCGKTSHSESLLSVLNDKAEDSRKFQHFSVSDIAKERKCIESYDEKLDTSVVDEDKLLDSLEPDLEKGGILVDWHCCDIFPERLIDLVVVLRTNNSLLYDRLKKRGYKDNKIQENIDCEIMEVIAQDARESYLPEIVIELESNSVEDMEENVDRIAAWTINWINDHPKGVTNELDPELVAAINAEDEDEDEDGEDYEEEEEDDEEEDEEDEDEE